LDFVDFWNFRRILRILRKIFGKRGGPWDPGGGQEVQDFPFWIFVFWIFGFLQKILNNFGFWGFLEEPGGSDRIHEHPF